MLTLVFKTALLSFNIRCIIFQMIPLLFDDNTFSKNFFLVLLVFFFNSLCFFQKYSQSSVVFVWWALYRNLSYFCCNSDISTFFIHDEEDPLNLKFFSLKQYIIANGNVLKLFKKSFMLNFLKFLIYFNVVENYWS